MSEVNRNEEVVKLEKQVEELEQLDKCESEVVDNTIEFEITKGDGKNYRVRMPTIREKTEINRHRLLEARKLQKDGFLYEAELVQELYEKQKIDVNKLSAEIMDINEEIQKMQLKLAPEHNNDNRDKLVEIIQQLQNDRIYKIAQKSNYLETAIESQLTEIMITHFAALIFEKKIEDKWVRVFENYASFIDSTDDKLVAVGVNYVYKLLF